MISMLLLDWLEVSILIQVGDRVMALWPPDGHYYPGLVVDQKGKLLVVDVLLNQCMCSIYIFHFSLRQVDSRV